MAVLSTNNLTLADWAKRVDPDGSVAVIANLLSQTNEILQDCVFVESNMATSHRVTVATGLPTVYWRSLNVGIAPSKGTTAQVDESLAILEARSEIDKDLAMLNGNTAAFRLSEARLFLEAMNQEAAKKLWYGNPASDPKEFLGFSGRYSQLSAGNGQNIIDAGGTGADNTSIWLIVWGDNTVFCPFPKGSQAGLTQRDLGEQTVYEAGGAGLRMQALCELFQWKLGLVVKDWRYAVRICNIDVSNLAALGTEQAPTTFTHIIHSMIRATARPTTFGIGRPAFYMNRTVFSGMQRIGFEKSQNVFNVNMASTQFGPSPTGMGSFMNIPIRLSDAIINTEARVT